MEAPRPTMPMKLAAIIPWPDELVIDRTREGGCNAVEGDCICYREPHEGEPHCCDCGGAWHSEPFKVVLWPGGYPA